MKPLVIKFGGSVITNKSIPQSFNEKVTRQLAQDLYESKARYSLVHGAGSFGHPLAQQFCLTEGLGKSPGVEQLLGVSLTHLAVRSLNRAVMEILHEAGIPAVSIPPFPFYNSSFDWSIFQRTLDCGFIPVTFGDVVFTDGDIAICSGDLLMKRIAAELSPKRAIFVTDVDGILRNPDDKTNILTDTTLCEIEQAMIQGSQNPDVTEGMAGKMREIKDMVHMGIEVDIINGKKKGRLLEAIRGNILGTRIRG